jgi:hypothetical protein
LALTFIACRPVCFCALAQATHCSQASHSGQAPLKFAAKTAWLMYADPRAKWNRIGWCAHAAHPRAVCVISECRVSRTSTSDCTSTMRPALQAAMSNRESREPFPAFSLNATPSAVRPYTNCASQHSQRTYEKHCSRVVILRNTRCASNQLCVMHGHTTAWAKSGLFKLEESTHSDFSSSRNAREARSSTFRGAPDASVMAV